MGAKCTVVQGLCPIGCLLLSLALEPNTKDRDRTRFVASANKKSYSRDSILQANLQQLWEQYPQAVFSYVDLWNAYKTTISNRTRYMFSEPFKACCGSPGSGPYDFDVFAFRGLPSAASWKACSNPRQFINWNGVHLTEAMYGEVADMLFHQGYCHPSFVTLWFLGSVRGNGISLTMQY